MTNNPNPSCSKNRKIKNKNKIKIKIKIKSIVSDLDRLWLKFIGYSNPLCARATRAIVNYASTSEYRLWFFLKEEFKYLCHCYPIKSRHHILHECQKFNNYWNPRRDLLSYFILFLECNSSTFAFNNVI